MINTNSGHVHALQHDTLDDEVMIVSQNGSLSITSLMFTYSYNNRFTGGSIQKHCFPVFHDCFKVPPDLQ